MAWRKIYVHRNTNRRLTELPVRQEHVGKGDLFQLIGTDVEQHIHVVLVEYIPFDNSEMSYGQWLRGSWRCLVVSSDEPTCVTGQELIVPIEELRRSLRATTAIVL